MQRQPRRQGRFPRQIDNLKPSIWSNLPHDVIFNMVEHLSGADLVNWSCVSREFFSFASARIWRHLRVSAKELEAYAEKGMILEPLNRQKSIIQFLVRNAYRKNPSLVFARIRSLDAPTHIYRPNAADRFVSLAHLAAPLPSFHIKALTIVQHPPEFRDGPGVNHVTLKRVLPALLSCLPNLVECIFEGFLHAHAFQVIAQFRALRLLNIRGGIMAHAYVPARSWSIPWTDSTLDFGPLANLKHLRTLKIGCFMIHEVQSLVKSIGVLELETFELSCHGKAYDENAQNWVSYSKKSASPLVSFLVNILRQDDERSGGLPRTLKTLVLCDRYNRNTPLLHQGIATAIAPCQSLRSLEITHIINERCSKSLDDSDMIFNQRRLAIQSWDRLASDENCILIYQYVSPTGKILSTAPVPDPGQEPVTNILGRLDAAADMRDSDWDAVRTTIFLRMTNTPSNAIIVLPGGCLHTAGPKRCYRCGKYDLSESEEVRQLRNALEAS